jgi:hypothetical protein
MLAGDLWRGRRLLLGLRSFFTPPKPPGAWGDGDAHVHMVWHQMPFENLAFLLPRQSVENLPKLPAYLAEDGFPAPSGHENDKTWYLQSHFEWDRLW